MNCRSGCALSSHRGIAGNAAYDARYVTAASAMPTSDEYSLLTMYRLSRACPVDASDDATPDASA